MSDEQTPENLEPEDIEQPNDEAPESDSPKDEGVSVESLQAEIAELKEGQLRLAAEAQNIRRRAEADVEKARKFGTESLIKDLPPVADSFERALEAARVLEGFDPAMLEGMEATQKLFAESLTKSGLESINPVGEAFNPEQASGDQHGAFGPTRQPRRGCCPDGLRAERPHLARSHGSGQPGLTSKTK